jgi:hypothetical protein
MKQLSVRPRRDAALDTKRTDQIDERPNGRMPAARAFPHIGTPPPRVIDARFCGNKVETRIQKVFRSEFSSLLIVLAVFFSGCAVLFLAAMFLGWF